MTKSHYMISTKLQLFGHRIDLKNRTIRPDHSKIEKLLNVPFPTTRKLLCSFLGGLNFFSEILGPIAEHLATLNTLLRNPDQNFKVNDTHRIAFEKIKNRLTHDNFILLPDLEKTFFIFSDTGPFYSAGILLQENENNHLAPIAFYNKTLSESESSFSQVEKEGIGLISLFKSYQYLLQLADIVLFTDCRSLSFIKQGSVSNLKLNRYSIFLDMFKYKVFFLRSNSNIIRLVDLLSRPNLKTPRNIRYADDILTNIIINPNIFFKYALTKGDMEKMIQECIQFQPHGRSITDLELNRRGKMDFKDKEITDEISKNIMKMKLIKKEKSLKIREFQAEKENIFKKENRNIYFMPLVKNLERKQVEKCKESKLHELVKGEDEPKEDINNRVEICKELPFHQNFEPMEINITTRKQKEREENERKCLESRRRMNETMILSILDDILNDITAEYPAEEKVDNQDSHKDEDLEPGMISGDNSENTDNIEFSSDGRTEQNSTETEECVWVDNKIAKKRVKVQIQNEAQSEIKDLVSREKECEKIDQDTIQTKTKYILGPALENNRKYIHKEIMIDSYWSGIYKLVEGNNPKILETFRIENGILFHIKKNPKIVIPDSLAVSIIHSIHVSHMYAHLGIEKTFTMLKDHLFIRKLKLKIQMVIRNCISCIETKPNNYLVSEQSEIAKGQFPNDVIHLDCMTIDQSHNFHVLLVVCTYSRFVRLICYDQTITSELVIELLLTHWFSAFGAPSIIMSDNASVLSAKNIELFYQMSGCKSVKIYPYNSKGLLAERFIRTTREKLRFMMINYQVNMSNWKIFIAYINIGLNTSPRSDKQIPSKIFLNRSITSGLVDLQNTEQQKIMGPVKEEFQKMREASKNIFNRDTVVGDIVYLKRHNIRGPYPKNQKIYMGPFLVEDENNTGLKIIEYTKGIFSDIKKTKSKWVHRNDIKRFKGAVLFSPKTFKEFLKGWRREFGTWEDNVESTSDNEENNH